VVSMAIGQCVVLTLAGAAGAWFIRTGVLRHVILSHVGMRVFKRLYI